MTQSGNKNEEWISSHEGTLIATALYRFSVALKISVKNLIKF